MEYCVVIPSIRELPLEYLEPILDDVQVVVVDDSNGAASRHDHPNILYCSHDFQDKYLPGAAEIIPRHNPSCKAFGLYYAWKEGWEIVILLDDDGQPVGERGEGQVVRQLPDGSVLRSGRFLGRGGLLGVFGQRACRAREGQQKQEAGPAGRAVGVLGSLHEECP